MAVIGRLVAILEAQTADFQARMTAAERVVQRFDSANTTATRGLRLVRGGIDQLAASAVGIHGPLGRVAEGLLQLGGTAALGVVAVMGEIALISRTVSHVLDEVAAAAQRGHDAFAGMAAQGKPLVTAMEKYVELQTKLDSLRQAPGIVERTLNNPFLPFSDVATAQATGRASEATGTALAVGVAKQRQDEERQLLATNRALEEFSRWLDGFTVTVPGGLGTPSTATRTGLAPDFSGAPAAYEASRRAAQAKLEAEERQKKMLDLVTGFEERGATVTQRRAEAVHAINTLELNGTITAKQAAQAMRGLELSIKDTGRQAQLTAAMMVTAFSQVIAGLISGGGIGGFLTGVGGLVSFWNPLAGAIVGGLGTIITSVENRSEQGNQTRHQELLATLRDTQAPTTLYLKADSGGPDAEFVDKVAAALGEALDRNVIVLPVAA